MKASLLLTGLTTGMMAVGAAHAADTALNAHVSTLHGQVLAAASTSGDGLLSTLRDLLSSSWDTHARAADHVDSRSAGSDDMHCGAADQAVRGATSPGPVGSATTGSTGVDGNIPAPPDNLRDATDMRKASPTLGWQSLLPGSIQ